MRTHYIQTNFSSGEMTPKLNGRVDLQRYSNAAKTAENVTVVMQGGLRRRDGLRFVFEAKYPDRKVRLIPWVFNREQAYVLEVGHQYIRFYRDGKIVVDATNPANPVIVEKPTTITEDMLDQLSYAQGADTMFFAHPALHPSYLKRLPGNHQWEFKALTFTPAPLDNIGVTPLGWLNVDKAQPVGAAVQLRLQESDVITTYNQDGWKAAHIGATIAVNDGLVRITAISSSTPAAVASGIIVRELTHNHLAAEGGWAVQGEMWSDGLGWPGCVALFQQRLLFAGSMSYPQTVWGSGIRDYTNFDFSSVDDAAAWSFQLDSDQINPVTALFATNALVALTHSGEFLIGGANNTITATNISVRVPSNYGASSVRPVRVGTDLIYVQRAGRKLLAMAYDPESQVAYEVSDISMLAEHMTSPSVSIVDATWQQEPDGLIQLVNSLGELLTVAYSRSAQINGWTVNHTGAVYDAEGKLTAWDKITTVASIPTTSGEDACYVAVKRTIGGSVKTYIELFTTGMNVDSGLVGEIPAGAPLQDVWGNLQHLEGKLVDIVADGVPMPQQTVNNGQIKLTRKAQRVHIGLPYHSTVRTYKPEFQSPVGTPQGAKVSSVNLTVRLLNSIGLTINGDPLPFRQFGPKILDQPPELFTGDIDWQLAGWDNNEVLIEQRQPLPFHLLAIIRTITVN